MRKSDIWIEILLVLTGIFVLVGTVTSTCHVWDKPYNLLMFKYLTWVDWVLLSIGFACNIAMRILISREDVKK